MLYTFARARNMPGGKVVRIRFILGAQAGQSGEQGADGLDRVLAHMDSAAWPASPGSWPKQTPMGAVVQIDSHHIIGFFGKDRNTDFKHAEIPETEGSGVPLPVGIHWPCHVGKWATPAEGIRIPMNAANTLFNISATHMARFFGSAGINSKDMVTFERAGVFEVPHCQVPPDAVSTSPSERYTSTSTAITSYFFSEKRGSVEHSPRPSDYT